jgi:DNA (cytosine-5)-methyltransferase 1
MRAIDLFAGAGGFSTGATMAGCNVVWAANHWQAAVDTHAANHPDTEHACQDMHQANWATVPAHDLLLASPACQGHTPARGKERAHHDATRSTAWAVISALEFHRPYAALVENVPAYMKWTLFPAWLHAAHALGYQVAPHLVDSADHGVAQNRLRVFLVLTRSARPLHLDLPRRDRVPATDVIDFSAGRWSQINRAGRAEKSLARVAAGRIAHGDRFAMAYYGAEKGGRSLSRPLGTITTRDRWAIVDGDRMRMISVTEAKAAMGFPSNYLLPENSRLAMHMLGNAVTPPAARDVIKALKEAA